MAIPKERSGRRFTYGDYLTWPDDDIDTVVQPDIAVVCDRSKLDDRGCRGAPDLVVEILSPSTAAKDLREKLDLYESRGVKEYWVLHPVEKLVTVFVLDDTLSYGKPSVYAGVESVPSRTFEGLSLDLKKVFAGK